MEVTTSRKPNPGIRTFSKDLAFSLGCHYTPRGKAGVGDIISIDEDVLVVSGSGRNFSINFYSDSELKAEILISSINKEVREGELVYGIRTGNQTLYDLLSSHMNILMSGCGESRLVFDGPQRRRYVLTLRDVS